jgi:hypothetical protein
MATRKNTDTAADATATEAQTEAVDATAVDATNVDASDDVDARSTLVAPSAEGLMTEADAPAQSADIEQEEDRTGKVPIKLANPIENPEHQRRLRLTEKPGGYNVHDVVWVTPDDARALITAGLAQVDPEDRTAVLAAIRGKHDGMRA